MEADESTLRLRWLIFSRIAIVTFLMGITTFIKIYRTELLPEISLNSLYVIISLTYLLSIVYAIFSKFIEDIKLNVYIQAFADVILITCLVYITGGIRSIYSVFYPLVIIYSAIFLEKGGGLIIASASSIFYGLLLDLEYYHIIRPLQKGIFDEYKYSAGYVFTRIIIHICSFYIIAFLASFVVEKEKQARLLLAEKESAFDQLDLLHKSIIESVDTGIMTINLQGKIKSFNRAAEEITGFLFKEVENKHIFEIFPEYAHVLERIKMEEPLKGVPKKRFEMEVRSKKNKILNLGCSISVLRDTEGNRIGDIILFQDLTEIKKMEEALEKSKKLALIGEMAAALAHEMRNPLASLSGSIQILKRDLKLNPADEKLMQIILRGKDQLENIVKDFLLLAKPVPGTKETFLVSEVIQDIIDCSQYVPDWNEHIRVNLSLSDNIKLHANKTEFREVVWNLIINSVQAMPEGGELSVKAKKSCNEEGKEFVEITVSDTGCGIEKKDLEKVFLPFFTTKEKGTGLGLAIVNRIVEINGGHIQFTSTPGQGTTCTVFLPCQ